MKKPTAFIFSFMNKRLAKINRVDCGGLRGMVLIVVSCHTRGIVYDSLAAQQKRTNFKRIFLNHMLF